MLARPPSTTRNVPPSLPVDCASGSREEQRDDDGRDGASPSHRGHRRRLQRVVKCNARCMRRQEPAFLDLRPCRSISPSPTSRSLVTPSAAVDAVEACFRRMAAGRGGDRAAAASPAGGGIARRHGGVRPRARASRAGSSTRRRRTARPSSCVSSTRCRRRSSRSSRRIGSGSCAPARRAASPRATSRRPTRARSA